MIFVSKKFPLDDGLIEGIRSGGATRRKAETSLFEKYHNFVYEGQRKHRLSEDECVSIYSDTIISVIDSILSGKFERRAELKTYLYQIFFNKCVDQIRKNTTNKASVYYQTAELDENLPFSDSARNAIQQLIVKNDIENLNNQLSKLGDKCKKMILLWGEAYSDEEIAASVGYQSAAVAKTSRLRCLERLRQNY